MPTPFELDQQARWEVAAVSRGVQKYRAIVEKREAHETAPGMMVMMKAAKGVVEAIETMQREAVTAPTNRAGWYDTFEAHDATTLAVIAMSTALRVGAVGESTPRLGVAIQTFSKRVMAALRDQEDFEAFEEAQAAAQKAALAPLKEELKAAKRGSDAAKQVELAKAIGSVRADRLVKLFRRENPTADRFKWARFAARHTLERKAYRAARRDRQEEEVTALVVGSALARALAQGAPEWFEVALSGDGPRLTQGIAVLLTEAATEAMADADMRAEVARPAMLPMICPPVPWTYREKEPECVTSSASTAADTSPQFSQTPAVHAGV